MILKQLSLFVENKPGALNAPCKVLAEKNINISTLSLADTKDFGILRILTKEWEKAKQALEEKGFAVKVTDVVAVEVENRPGGLSHILEVLEKHSLNVEYMYAFTFGKNNRAVLIFRFDDPEAATKSLKNEKTISLVRHSELFL